MENEENTNTDPERTIDIPLGNITGKEEEKEVIEPYVPKTKEYLWDLAQDVVGGKVYTSFHIQDQSLMGSVFMPIMLAGKDYHQWMLDSKIAMFYADLADAGPRSINGHPMFFKMGVLNDVDTKIFAEMHDDIIKEHEEKKSKLDKYGKKEEDGN